MIYTVTLNPTLDHNVFVSDLKAGKINKMNKEAITVGGRGINVSLVLSELDVKSKALGFVAGFTGYEIERQVQARGIETDFVWLESGLSRVNIKVKNFMKSTVRETEIDSEGPDVPDEAIKQLFVKLSAVEDGDVLVLAGGVPHSMQKDIYEQILEYVAGKNIKVAVDASGELIASTLKHRPFLIKPNMDELGDIFGENPSSRVEAIAYAKQLQDMGAQNVLISMGSDGAVLLDDSGKTRFCDALKGKVRNSVGAGDAMLAGFLSAMLDKDVDLDYALMLGTAAGGATAFSDGLARKAEILDQMKVLLKDHAKGTV